MIVFAYEFVTGGGLAGQPLPEELAHEADLMLRALVAELLLLPDIRVRISRDPRLPGVAAVESLVAAPGEDPFALYRRGLEGAGAAWPTAPETGGALERLAELTLAQKVILLGSRPEAVRIGASKRETALRLASAGIPVVPTFGPRDSVPPVPGPWVIKPDDGAGCEGVRLVADWREAERELGVRAGLVAQPWLAGEPASLSLLCREGEATLLSLNRQHVAIAEGQPRLTGLEVNAETGARRELSDLASRIAEAVPGLCGYVGVDLILGAGGAMVLELNPRLTTSYCALGPALGINVAELVLRGAMGSAPPPVRPGRGAAVTIDLDPSHV